MYSYGYKSWSSCYDVTKHSPSLYLSYHAERQTLVFRVMELSHRELTFKAWFASGSTFLAMQRPYGAAASLHTIHVCAFTQQMHLMAVFRWSSFDKILSRHSFMSIITMVIELYEFKEKKKKNIDKVGNFGPK